jgi:DNA-directed RNA polymerase specialized sigma24 family protein
MRMERYVNMPQCRECDKELIQNTSRQEFCDDYCRGAYHRRKYRQQAVEEAEDQRQARIEGRGTPELRKEASEAMARILAGLSPRIRRRF